MVELGIRPREWTKVSEENKTSLTLASDPLRDNVVYWKTKRKINDDLQSANIRKKTIIAWRDHAMPYCAAFAIHAQEALRQ